MAVFDVERIGAMLTLMTTAKKKTDSDSGAARLDPTSADLRSAPVTSGGLRPSSVADSDSGEP